MPHVQPITLTIAQVAEHLQIGRRLAERLVAEGAIPSIKVGRLRRVPAVALAEYVESELEATR